MSVTVKLSPNVLSFLIIRSTACGAQYRGWMIAVAEGGGGFATMVEVQRAVEAEGYVFIDPKMFDAVVEHINIYICCLCVRYRNCVIDLRPK